MEFLIITIKLMYLYGYLLKQLEQQLIIDQRAFLTLINLKLMCIWGATACSRYTIHRGISVSVISKLILHPNRKR